MSLKVGIRVALLAALLGTPACASVPSAAGGDATAPAGARPARAVPNPDVDRAAVERLVRERFGDSKLASVQVELKDLRWAADHLEYQQLLYAYDSPAWIVSFQGEIRGEPGIDAAGGEVPHVFKSGTCVVSVDHGQIINVRLHKQ